MWNLLCNPNYGEDVKSAIAKYGSIDSASQAGELPNSVTVNKITNADFAKSAAADATKLKDAADAAAKDVGLSDKALATIGKHADWKGGAIAGTTLGGAVGAFSDDDDRRVEE